ncbi:hypothetical protein AAFC00_001981 [Neodothiora populina]|uniref:Monopolin complex subunit Csm1/Pcs1 C-terminal domain-containing protein n=1 Tax=Neodothiora populina TaxID=2781224 RepID=A0ABR3PFY1_9PEZI
MAPRTAAARHVDESDLADDLLNPELVDADEEPQPAQPVINRTVVKKKPSAASAKQCRATATDPAVKKTSATRAASSKSSGASKETKAPREALKDRTNMTDGADDANKTEEVDEFDDDDAAAPVAGSAPVKTDQKVKKARATTDPREAADHQQDHHQEEEAEAPPAKKPRLPKTKAAAATSTATSKEIPDSQVAPTKVPKTKLVKRGAAPTSDVERKTRCTIPEAQVEPQPEEASQTIEAPEPDNMDIDQEAPQPVKPSRSSSQQRRQPLPTTSRARSSSTQARQYGARRSGGSRAGSRAGSVSDTERRLLTDHSSTTATATAKKLQDMTRRYDDMRIKYESLQEIAQNAAESNFDRLKKLSDEKTRDANALIASLQKQVQDLRKSTSQVTSESARRQSRISQLETTNEKLREDHKSSTASLAEAQNEIKSLNARLDAARKTAHQSDKLPTSSSGTTASRSAAAAAALNNTSNANGPEALKHAALKEELYRDLTGLIINSVKRRDDEDEFSCIQTGRNGTLHFHLTISNDSSSANPKTPTSKAQSYEDTEFAYEPLLDEQRDRELIDVVLPDYLAEEICFPRGHAVKFYTKVVESMTRRVIVEDDDEDGDEGAAGAGHDGE